MAREVGKVFVTIGGSLKPLMKDLHRAKTAVVRFARATDKLGMRALAVGFRRAARAVKVFTLALAAGATALAVSSIKYGAAFEEMENRFAITMGSMANEAKAWSNSMSGQFESSIGTIMDMLSTTKEMSQSMGLSERAAYTLSKGVVQLTQGFSSFDDLPIEEAFRKIRAGLSGEVEPLKYHGILVHEEIVKQWALQNGLIKTGQTLSQTGKIVARYGVILEAMKNRVGDSERTVGSLTNRMRSAREAFKDLQKSIHKNIFAGEGFKNMFTAIRQLFLNLAANMPQVSKAFSSVFDAIANWVAVADIKFQKFYTQLESMVSFTTHWAKQMVNVFDWLGQSIGYWFVNSIKKAIDSGMFSLSVGLEKAKGTIGKVGSYFMGGRKGQLARDAINQRTTQRIQQMQNIHNKEQAKLSIAPPELNVKSWDASKYVNRMADLNEQESKRLREYANKKAELQLGKKPTPVPGVGELGPLGNLAVPKDQKDKYKAERIKTRFESATGDLGIESFSTRSRISRLRAQGAFAPRFKITDKQQEQINQQKRTNELLQRALDVLSGRSTSQVVIGSYR